MPEGGLAIRVAASPSGIAPGAGGLSTLGVRGSLLSLLASAALAGAAYAGFAWLRAAREQPHVVEATIGQAKLAISSRFLRPSSRHDGPTPALEAAVFFPGFAPAGDFDDVTAKTDLDRRLAETVSIVVRSPNPSLDPVDRTARLYERFLEDDAWSTPAGSSRAPSPTTVPFAATNSILPRRKGANSRPDAGNPIQPQKRRTLVSPRCAWATSMSKSGSRPPF
jgi:hypothetical protein